MAMKMQTKNVVDFNLCKNAVNSEELESTGDDVCCV